jgi:PST family polysaccharide transporter
MRDPRRPYGTVLAFVIASGGLLTLGVIAVAPLFAALTPELPPHVMPDVLRVFAIWILLDGLAVVPRAFFERELSVGALLAPEVWRGVVAAVVSIALAAAGWSYWSFVAGDLAGAALLAAWCWSRVRGRMPLQIELHLLPDLLRKSVLLFLVWLLVQLVTYVDVFVVQWFGDVEVVGLYGRCYWLVFLVATLAYPRALFPSLVAYLADRRRFVEVFRLGTVQLAACQALASWFLLFNAERTLTLLFGAEWAPAAPILRVLSFAPLFYQLTILGGEMLKAEHRDRVWLVIELLNLASLVGFGIWLTARRGAEGMALANYLLVGNLLMAWEIRRVFGARFRRLVADLALLYGLPLPLFALAAWLFPAGSWPRFAASLAAAAVAAAAFAALYWRPFHAFFATAGAGADGSVAAPAPSAALER